jgi:hypothetical protein
MLGSSVPALARMFKASCIGLLALTAAAKLVSITGHDRLLEVNDWVLHIEYRYVMLLAACVECGIVGVLLIARDEATCGKSVLWFCALAIDYRVLHRLVGPTAMCPCLGTLTNKLNIRPIVADRIMCTILVYLLVGSALWLVFSRLRPSNMVVTGGFECGGPTAGHR